MAWSLPAKTGWRTKVSTRSMMVDSRCMAIPLVISNDDALSDLLSIPSQVAYQSSRSSPIATRRRVRRLRTPCRRPAPPPGRAREGRSWSPRDQAGGPRGSHPVIRRRRRPSRPSRVSRQRVEGRTRRWFRLSWGIDFVIAPRTGGGGSGSSSSRVGRRGAPWANCCLWTTTRT